MEAMTDGTIITWKGILQLRYSNINGFIVKPNTNLDRKLGNMDSLKKYLEDGLKSHGAMNPNSGFIRAKLFPYSSEPYYVFILDPVDNRYENLYKQFADFVSTTEKLYILMLKDFVDVTLLEFYNDMLKLPVVDTERLPKNKLFVQQAVIQALRGNGQKVKIDSLNNELMQPQNRSLSDLALSVMQGYVIFVPPIYELNS